jgi:hypothetical protein
MFRLILARTRAGARFRPQIYCTLLRYLVASLDGPVEPHTSAREYATVYTPVKVQYLPVFQSVIVPSARSSAPAWPLLND